MSTKPQTFIIFSSIHYTEDLWQRPQQLANQMMKKGYRVIFVNNRCGVISVNLDLRRVGKVADDFFSHYFLQHANTFESNITVLNKIDLLVDHLGNRVWARDLFIEQLIKFFRTEYTKLICYLPEFGASLKKVKQELDIPLFYDCVDEMTGFHQTKKVVMEEAELLELCDGVIVTSKTLFVHKGEKNSNCMLVPNGVNYEQFLGESEKPAELTALKGPIIGYVGAVEHWVDQDLLSELAEGHPEWNFVLVGTIYVDVDKLKNYPNVYLLGRKEYDQVPAYTRHFDVGIIPFKINDLIINTNPIKYYEYAAAGIRTVSVPMPELIGEPYCDLASNSKEFAEKINSAIKGCRIQTDLPYLQANSWESRAEQVIHFMQQDLPLKVQRTAELERIVAGYEGFLEQMPLLNVLAAEIYQQLHQQTKSQKILVENKEKIQSTCLSIQLKLAIERKDVTEILALLSLWKPNYGDYDSNYWKQKGTEFLIIYALRKSGQIDHALRKAQELQSSSYIHEELGNIYVEIEDIEKAIAHYARAYKENGKIETVEAAYQFSRMAKEAGLDKLYDLIVKQHGDRIAFLSGGNP